VTGPEELAAVIDQLMIAPEVVIFIGLLAVVGAESFQGRLTMPSFAETKSLKMLNGMRGTRLSEPAIDRSSCFAAGLRLVKNGGWTGLMNESVWLGGNDWESE